MRLSAWVAAGKRCRGIDARRMQGAIHFEEGVPGPDRVQRVLGLYTRAVASRETDALSDADREELSARSATFADLNADAATAEQTAAAHAVLTRSLALKAADSRKRPAEAGAAAAGTDVDSTGPCAMWKQQAPARCPDCICMWGHCWTRRASP